MFRSFRLIDEFVKDLYGVGLVERPIPAQLNRIAELKSAYDAIETIVRGRRKPFAAEFVRYVYPVLEVAVHWEALKKKGKLTEGFLNRCRQRVKRQSDFYGTIFEIDMASRCLLSGWEISFVEDHAEEVKQIDFVFFMRDRGGRAVGVECLSKRYTADGLTIDKVNAAISDKAQKYENDNICKLADRLGVSLNQRLLIIDLTKSDYSVPEVLAQLDTVRRSTRLDGVLFTWRQDFTNGGQHVLRVQYKAVGDIGNEYFSATYEARFGEGRNGPFFFMRPYVYPEPTVRVGQPETIEEHNRKQGRQHCERDIEPLTS